MFSEEFTEAFKQQWASDPSSYYEAFGFLGFIVVLLIVIVSTWVSIRLMLTFVYLKTGNSLSGKSNMDIAKEFKKHLK